MQNLLFSSILPQVAYDPINGKFYRVRKNSEVATEVFPDETGKLFIAPSVNQKKLLMKAIKVAWIILNSKEVPNTHTVYAKNFDTTDCRAFNIGILPNEDFAKLREAFNNIHRDLKIKPHKTDQYSCVIQFRENGILRKLICADVIQAKKLQRRLLVKYTKIVGKYLSTE
jgi:hypothetical protein